MTPDLAGDSVRAPVQDRTESVVHGDHRFVDDTYARATAARYSPSSTRSTLRNGADGDLRP
jgi:hypothetical protein